MIQRNALLTLFFGCPSLPAFVLGTAGETPALTENLCSALLGDGGSLDVITWTADETLREGDKAKNLLSQKSLLMHLGIRAGAVMQTLRVSAN